VGTRSEPASAAGSDQSAEPPDATFEPTLPVAAVARRLGIAPATLRTWDRRYGIGPSGHTTGRHRRYAPADIARLELMQRALLRGATPAEAADYALRASVSHRGRHNAHPVGLDRLPVHRAARGSGVNAAFDAEVESVIAAAVDAVSATEPAPAEFEPAGTRSVRAGGRVLRLPGGSPTARGLARAALAMDGIAAQQLIAGELAGRGVVVVWDEVVRPVLAALASQWEHSGDCVEVEHLVYECTLAAMIGATPTVTAPRNPRPVLLCCVPDERHSLPLYALRAALARREIGTQMLGAALPVDALAAAVRRTGPAAVALWAHLPRHARPGVFDHVPRTRQRVRLFACGPGWFATELPSRVEQLDDLADAAERIETLVLGTS
jgi:MerR family transcriptional regulator, light-induced transcriptional regulator